MALAVLAAVGVFLAVASHQARTAPVRITGQQQEFMTGFVRGCAQGAPESACRCIAARLVTRGGIETHQDVLRLAWGIRRAILTQDVGAIPAEFRDAAIHCR